MMLRSRVAGVAMGILLVAAMGLVPSLAQDPAAEKLVAKTAKTTVTKTSRRVPPLFAKVGLTAEQKEKIYAIRGKHQAEIADLKAKIDEIEAKELIDCEDVLLESQKKVLNELRAAAKSTKKAN